MRNKNIKAFLIQRKKENHIDCYEVFQHPYSYYIFYTYIYIYIVA